MENPANANIPQSIVALLRGEPTSFDPGNYIRRFARAPFAYLEGFREFCEACVLDGGFKGPQHAVAMVRAATIEAVEAVPRAWRAEFPKGQWDRFDPNQVTQAFDYSPMLLEKALLVVLATRIACQRPVVGALHKLDPFKFITIHPAIYRLTGQETCGTLLHKLRGRMRKDEHAFIGQLKLRLQSAAPRKPSQATDARAGQLLLQALEGRPMTWKNADDLRTAFNETVFRPATPGTDAPFADCVDQKIGVRVLDGRSDGGLFTKNKYCNEHEGPFVTPCEQDHAAMRAAVNRSAAAFKRSHR